MGHSKATQVPPAPCDSTNSDESSSSLAYLSVESQIKGYCRVCWDSTDSDAQLISPCGCKGTQKYVHVKCLRKWQENVQKRDLRDERAFRCGVCQVRYSLAPPTTRWPAKFWQILRGLGGVVCVSLLAFGLAGPPWPHLALLALIILGTRSHGMLAVALLAAGTILAALHVKGLRVNVHFDDMGKVGVSLVRHGAPIPGLGPGTLLVASSDLDDSIFKRSVVLIYEHGEGRGSKGVILNQPLTVDARTLHKHEDVSSLSNHDASIDLINPKKATVTAHRLGGPVGMPGEGARQAMIVLHSIHDVQGASLVLPGMGDTPPIYQGGRLIDIMAQLSKEGNDHVAKPSTTAMMNTPVKQTESTSSSAKESSTQVDPSSHTNHNDKNSSSSGSNKNNNKNNNDRNRGLGQSWTSKPRYKNSHNINDNKRAPSILVFHGISTWTEGQLEGEIRAKAWSFGDAMYEDVMLIDNASGPDDLWSFLMASQRIKPLAS